METQIPSLETERLILRGLTVQDAPAYAKYFIDFEVIGHLSVGVPWPYPPEGVLDYIQNNVLPTQGKDKWAWGIFLKDNPEELIGAIDLLRKANPANRGFWLGKPFWGKGIMTEAANAVLDFAFTELGFEELIFANAVGNDRSARIKEKTGSRFLRREPAQYVDPKYTERDLWILTKVDWQKSINS